MGEEGINFDLLSEVATTMKCAPFPLVNIVQQAQARGLEHSMVKR